VFLRLPPQYGLRHLSRMGAKYFELWGYPGAGKTAISNVLRTHCRVIEPPQPDDLDHRAAGHLITRLTAFARSGVFTDYLRGIESRRQKRAAVGAVAKRQARVAAEYDPPLLFEEGITHHIWRALYAEPRFIGEHWWKAHIRHNAAQVIVLDVSRHLARSRIQTKAQPGPINSELRNAPLNGERWERARTAFEAIDIELKASLRSVARLDVDHVSVAEASAKVHSIISNLGHHTPLPA
jgi:hypothetical protein